MVTNVSCYSVITVGMSIHTSAMIALRCFVWAAVPGPRGTFVLGLRLGQEAVDAVRRDGEGDPRRDL